MRRILFLTMIAVFSAGTVFAQKTAVKDAKRALGRDDLKEASTLIKQASTHAETAGDAETWKIMGDIGNKAFDLERTKAMLGKESNDKAMYDGLLESYNPYLKADSLGELPDAKGKVKNRFRKDIAGILRANHPFYINGGVFYNDQKDYRRATDFFQIYWDIPSLPMYQDQKVYLSLTAPIRQSSITRSLPLYRVKTIKGPLQCYNALQKNLLSKTALIRKAISSN